MSLRLFWQKPLHKSHHGLLLLLLHHSHLHILHSLKHTVLLFQNVSLSGSLLFLFASRQVLPLETHSPFLLFPSESPLRHCHCVFVYFAFLRHSRRQHQPFFLSVQTFPWPLFSFVLLPPSQPPVFSMDPHYLWILLHASLDLLFHQLSLQAHLLHLLQFHWLILLPCFFPSAFFEGVLFFL